MGRLSHPEQLDQLDETTQTIRDLVNIRRRHRALMKDAATYHTVCSAMDTLGDTAHALSAYHEQPSPPDKGHAYLLAYGVLQTLYLQQDAAFWLCKSLGVTSARTFKAPGRWAQSVDPLWAAREARNNSIGHPVRRDKVKPLASYFIVQSSLDAGGFQMLELDEHGKHQFVSVSTTELAQGQLTALVAILMAAANELRAADAAHCGAFMEKPLTGIFAGMDYVGAQLGGKRDDNPRLLMAAHVSDIEDRLAKLRAAIAERAEPFEEDLEWSYRKLGRALRVLRDHVADLPASDADLADVAADFVWSELHKLRDYAQSIDDDYAASVSDTTPGV